MCKERIVRFRVATDTNYFYKEGVCVAAGEDGAAAVAGGGQLQTCY